MPWRANYEGCQVLIDQLNHAKSHHKIKTRGETLKRPHPCKPFACTARARICRSVLTTDPSLITQAIDQIKQKAIVDFAAIGLIALGYRGYLDVGCTRKQALDVFGKIAVNNLRYAAKRLASEGLRGLIEPINPRDIPGYFLNRQDDAIEILDEVG
ncbi:MAG: hypothetical protein RL109_2306, partial [Pseudomonadota bacterium]